MSHWFSDVVPFYWCCAWTDSLTTCRNNYATRRPTPDCSTYESPDIGNVLLTVRTNGQKCDVSLDTHVYHKEQFPSAGGSYGDPHLVTLDGLQYTFNGEGEFWMVKTTDNGLPDAEIINIQGRMEPIGKISD